MADDENRAIDAELGAQQLDDERARAIDAMAVPAIFALDVQRSVDADDDDRTFDRLLTMTEAELSER